MAMALSKAARRRAGVAWPALQPLSYTKGRRARASQDNRAWPCSKAQRSLALLCSAGAAAYDTGGMLRQRARVGAALRAS